MIVKYFIVAAVLQVVTGQRSCHNFTSHPNWRLLDNGKNCGQSRYDQTISERIIGGRNASFGEFPWMAALMQTGIKYPQLICGGSIISQWYILTAAHCVKDELGNELFDFVRIGENKLHSHTYCSDFGGCSKHAIDMEVRAKLVHEQFNENLLHNDIALILLRHKILFTDYIRPICLPTHCSVYGHSFNSELMTVAGWGLIDQVPEEVEVDELQKVVVPVIPLDRCYKLFGERMGVICAGGPTKDACAGDSGGPLMYRAAADGPARRFVIGIVSFGDYCTKQPRLVEKPGVYTRVDHYLPWILDTIVK